MKRTERINIRRAINALEVEGRPLRLPKAEYILSSVRSTAGCIAADTGKKFNVDSTDSRVIIVRRVS